MSSTYTSPAPPRAFLLLVAAGFFMQSLDTTILNTALPVMAQGLQVDALRMQPVIVAYTLTMALLIPASGWLADRFGTRPTYFFAVLVFALGSLLCALSQSLPQLVAARVVQGVGGAMLLPIGRLALLRNVAPERYIAALAMVTIAGQAGPLLGPPLGGWMVQYASWHWIFLINLPIAAFGLWAIRRYMPEDRIDEAPRFDLPGFLLVSVCMISLSLALDTHPDSTRAAWWMPALLATSVAAAAAYVWYARGRPGALFRLSLFREPNFSIGLIGNLLCRIGSNAVPFMLPLMLQLRLGFSPLAAGMMIVPAAIGGLITKRYVAGLVTRYGYRAFLQVNTVLVGASIMAFGLIDASWPLWVQIIPIVVFGASNSMQFAVMNGATLGGLKRADAGSGNSLFSMVQMLATGLGVTISASMMGALTESTGSTASGFSWTFVLLGGVTLLSGLIFRRVRTSPRGAVRDETGRPVPPADQSG